MSTAIAPVENLSSAELDQLCVNTIRTLSIDAVQQARFGHPGTPMALAPLVYTIWNRVLRFDPRNPIWPNRDRSVLSNGHASMLLWSALHLTGVDQAADTPNYRQGAKGYAQRFGANYANIVIDNMVGSALLPSLLHQDPRYFTRAREPHNPDLLA